jgi:hypothetical protein
VNYDNQTEISIQVGLDGFSFCISTPADSTIRAFRYYSFSNAILQQDILDHTSQIMHNDELLRLHHQKARIIYIGRLSTLVPNEFFKPGLLKKLLEFNQAIDDLDEIHYNDINFINSKLVFALPTYFAGLITSKFKQAVFFNQATPLLLLINSIAKNKEGNTIVVNLNKEFFDIAVMKDNNLKFYNNFLYVNSTDLLYFILYVCRQLGVDNNNGTFYLLGERSDKKELIVDLSAYIKNIITIDSIPDIQYAADIHIPDPARFATLLNLAKCG